MTENREQRMSKQSTDHKQSDHLMSENLSSAFDTESTPMITPSEVIEHLYCARFTYFMNCLNISQHEELRYKVLKGREAHENRERQNRDYLRSNLGCVKKEISVYIADRDLGVRGIIDEVLYLTDDTLAPLDYKYAEYADYTFETHKIQSVLYAMLIAANYGKEVRKGFICYTRSRNKVKEIVYSDEDFQSAQKVVLEIFRIILYGYFPKKTRWRKRCVDCCYKNICA